jgi:ribonuclease P protein subunit RPR2
MGSNIPACTNVPQRHIYSRISYLHQAASNLVQGHLQGSGQRDHGVVTKPVKNMLNTKADDSTKFSEQAGKMKLQSSDGLSRYLLHHLHGISLKGQIRLDSAIKHRICKRCDALLLPGSTSTSCVENRSKNGAKPWADVLVITCNSCHAARRFPIGAVRQQKRKERPNS